MAVGISAVVWTVETPSADPPLAGLTTSGRPTRDTSASMTMAAPSSRKLSAGSATDRGVRTPARATTCLAIGLSKATRAAAGGDPTYGTSASCKISPSAPSSPTSPCRRGITQSGRTRRSIGSSCASTSLTEASTPAEVIASATRRPDRKETSRSWERPPARTRMRSRDMGCLSR
jgi:hypothetical protein